MNTFEKEYYEASTFWSDGALTDDANAKRIRSTIDLIPGDVTSLVDIGCGNGVLLNKLKLEKPEMHLVGIDRSEAALKYVNSQKRIGDILDIPEDNNSYDCVTCLQVLEHISLNVYEVALSELARVSIKYIIASVPYKEKIEDNVTTCPKCKTIFNVDLHLRSYNDHDIQSLFEKYGFKLTNKVNVVKKFEYPVLKSIRMVKEKLFAPKAIEEFRSPICPVCGYKNEDFEIDKPGLPANDLQTNNSGDSLKSRMKNRIKSILPKVERDGYWIIALYEKGEG